MGRETRENIGNTERYRLHIFLTFFFGEHRAVLENFDSYNIDRNRTTKFQVAIIIGLVHRTFIGR